MVEKDDSVRDELKKKKRVDTKLSTNMYGGCSMGSFAAGGERRGAEERAGGDCIGKRGVAGRYAAHRHHRGYHHPVRVGGGR